MTEALRHNLLVFLSLLSSCLPTQRSTDDVTEVGKEKKEIGIGRHVERGPAVRGAREEEIGIAVVSYPLLSLLSLLMLRNIPINRP